MLKRTLGFALIAVASFIALPFLAPSALGQDVVFREIEPLTQECEASASVYYTWFVYNNQTSSYLLEVWADPASGQDWSSDFNRDIMVLHPGESSFVNMSVSASNDISSMTVNQTVTLVLTNLDDTSDVLTYTSQATTDFIPKWGVIAPGKNKLLDRFDNPLPAPFDNNYGTFALNIGIWALVALIFAFIVDPAVRYFTKKTKTDLDDRILKILRVPIFALVVIFGVVSSLSILQLSEGEVGVIFEIYGVFLIVILTFIVYKIFKEVLVYLGRRWASKTSTEIDDVLIPVIDKVGGLIILVFGAVGIISYFGYDITILLAGVGVGGLVIAFAAQDVLSNLFSGVFLLLDRPFVEGDYITLNTGELCRVEKIGIRSTRLYDTLENDYVILPNNKLVNDKIINMEQPDEQGKGRVEVGVAYGTDIEKVEKMLLEIVAKHPKVLNETGKEPVVRFLKFGESSLEFAAYYWIDSFMNKWVVAHEIRKQIYLRFAKEGIEIPLPQRTIYIKEMPKQK